jgi:hypothetical protein
MAGGTINLVFEPIPSGECPSWCQAQTMSLNEIHLYNFKDDVNSYYLEFILTHELGHIIQDKNPGFVSDFYKIFSSDYKNGNFPSTINCPRKKLTSDQQTKECFSDFQALYVTYPKYSGGAKDLSDYPTNINWSKYYQFMYTNVFGTTEVFATGGSKNTSDYALGLAHAIIRACPPPPNYNRNTGYVYKGSGDDSSCLDNLPGFSPKADVIQTLKDDIIPLCDSSGNCTRPNLQCVAFAHAVSVGVKADIGGRNAAEYANPPAIPGYQWISYSGSTTPDKFLRLGDYAIWKGSGGGQHIAVVVGILSGGRVKFAEANGGDGSVDIPTQSNASINHSGWNLKGVQRKL